MPMNVHLVVIDPQNDFMGMDQLDNGLPVPYTVKVDNIDKKAALPVAGGVSDMKRLGSVIERLIDKLSGIQVTLDSHRVIDISHPGMWRDQQGKSPDPFTIISAADIESGMWLPRVQRLKGIPSMRDYCIGYAKSLAASKGQYPLMIWPEHCLIGTWGHNVQVDLVESLQKWERKRLGTVDYVVKGDSIITEHYGALMAEVPWAGDSRTQLNGEFLQVLQDADIIGLAGEASSHCVKSTIQQIADHIGQDHVKKFQIITDCTSPVLHPLVDFPAIAKGFFSDMEKLGMKLTTADEFMA